MMKQSKESLAGFAESGKLVVTNKRKAEQMLATIGIQPSEVSRIINLSKEIVTQSEEDVKGIIKYSLSKDSDGMPAFCLVWALA